jgi:BirA family transcriptional regulator, biotin operon repressor / biotin---[acetyl-CoA-carboxylase] ligase
MEYRVIQHGIVDSTNERAFVALREGAARHLDVHVARGQTHGRGRQGSNWQSAEGEGLFMSLVLRPPAPPVRPPALTIATGLAVIEALSDVGLPVFDPGAPLLKWPNDVLVDGAKLCGILTESRGFNPQDPHFVIGIGVNVRQRKFPRELIEERDVTSLAKLGLDVRVEEVMDAILARLSARLMQARRDHRLLAEDFLDASGLRNRVAVVHSGSNVWRGTICSLSLIDGLELDCDTGEVRHIPVEFIKSVIPVDPS